MSVARRFLEELREEVRTTRRSIIRSSPDRGDAVYASRLQELWAAALRPGAHVHDVSGAAAAHTPDSEAKLWLARVLVDEYGEGSEGKDHRRFIAASYAPPGPSPGRAVERPCPRGGELYQPAPRHDRAGTVPGRFGRRRPGHEWAIPHMFPPLIDGLRRAGFSEEEINYFTLHIAQDENHGAWLEEALFRYCDTSAGQAQVRQGTLASLECRRRFWIGVERRVVAWRQPRSAQHTMDRARQGLQSTLTDVVRLAPWAEKPLDRARRRAAVTLEQFLCSSSLRLSARQRTRSPANLPHLTPQPLRWGAEDSRHD